ncbi:hypothetical protein ACVGVM_08695 [Pseudonocardia bannensis]|uniref:Uncharacterized protein n=1 Tax=Pseudonocardia bannensis TaxID=630973 RepID=A0A848DLS1_9PSEU|nr:hypothetical protein [Pseudonocardia bannensis]NMH93489.1 hypothetical protein [Pseudonocardia bannensis]
MELEFGIVARCLRRKRAGFIQTSEEEIVFFWARDAHRLKLNENNQIVFAQRYKKMHCPNVGDLIVFERN